MLLSSVGAYAQNMFNMSSLHPGDTLREKLRSRLFAILRFVRPRLLPIFFSAGHFDSDLNGNAFGSGKSQIARISSFSRYR